LNSFTGGSIWTDNENVYYSHDTTQYILNKTTNTWEPWTWEGFVPSDKKYIWTDGENFYYSSNTNQYLLDKNTHTWNPISWGSLSFYGNNVWSDGTNIYYSDYNTQYKLFHRLPNKILVSNINNEFVSMDAKTLVE